MRGWCNIGFPGFVCGDLIGWFGFDLHLRVFCGLFVIWVVCWVCLFGGFCCWCFVGVAFAICGCILWFVYVVFCELSLGFLCAFLGVGWRLLWFTCDLFTLVGCGRLLDWCF